MTLGPYAPMDTHSARALRARLDRFARYDPHSREDLVRLEGIILGAALCEDEQLEFDARTQWMATSYMHVRSLEVHRENLHWCLRHLEEHRESADERAYVRILHAITRLIDESTGDPDVPRHEIQALIGIFRDVRTRAGLGGHSEQELRMEVALELGDAPEALYRQGLAEDEVPDALSACTGCAALDAIRLEKAMGRYAHAAAIAVGVLGVLRPGCRSQPHSLQALALLPLSLTGHRELAIECAESAWPGLLDNAFAHGYAGHLLLWCAWSGQTRQAVELLEEYLPILEDNPRPVGERMRFLTGAAVVARRAAEDLGPDAAIGGARAGFLARRWSDEARGLAARFDERNGSEAVGRRTHAALTVPAWDGSTIEALPAPALGRAARGRPTPRRPRLFGRRHRPQD